MSPWILLVAVLLTAALVLRRWLPDRAGVSEAVYDAWRALVPAPRPTVRLVTKRVVRTCRRQRVALPYGAKAVLPRAFRVGLSVGEYQVVLPLLDTVQEAVAESLLRTARERQWLHDGPPGVRLVQDETVAEGRPRVLSTSLPAPERAGGSPTAGIPPGPPREVRPRVERESTAQLPEPEPTRDHRRPDLAREPTAAETGAAGLSVVHRLRGRDGAADLVIGPEGTVLGRDHDCDVPVDYPAASRRHLRIVATTAGCRLEDLGSRHGTRVNDVAVTRPTLLRPQDTVRIGAQGPSWTYQPSYGAAAGDDTASPTRRNVPVGWATGHPRPREVR